MHASPGEKDDTGISFRQTEVEGRISSLMRGGEGAGTASDRPTPFSPISVLEAFGKMITS